ncbi:hypothetical protein M407DRAFT_128109 [Tulasnella calospora MUT 4182]|uniref:Uncharacterized protein n=1 Tax=Tulasnella calospora MUT 4182 TaxID=1051891 RepID=A0A0C3QWU3_9AGAM|nr:hypothetical protein M407DRAFT_128109 [Tulasnella calospora MUT 4182]
MVSCAGSKKRYSGPNGGAIVAQNVCYNAIRTRLRVRSDWLLQSLELRYHGNTQSLCLTIVDVSGGSSEDDYAVPDNSGRRGSREHWAAR